MASVHTTPEEYITLSLGCALYRGERGKSLEFYDGRYDRTRIAEHPLIRQADEALLLAKSTGKNRSICLEKIV
jgi:GGDEF domain-containing protein